MVFFVVAALQLGYLAGLHAERGAKNEELIYIFDGVEKKKNNNNLSQKQVQRWQSSQGHQ
jgi:hypothetical protein